MTIIYFHITACLSIKSSNLPVIIIAVWENVVLFIAARINTVIAPNVLKQRV